MNPQLEKYISERKQERKLELKKQRDEHLISLGLIDESKTEIERVLLDTEVYVKGSKYDKELNKYYIEDEIKHPIDITEEEYQELLKYIPKKQAVVSEVNKDASRDLTALNKLFKVLVIIFLILGIIFTITGCNDLGKYRSDPTNLIIGITSIILSVTLFIRRIFIKGFIVIVENAERSKCKQ